METRICKTVSQKELSENGYIVYSKYYNLPNKQVLFFSVNDYLSQPEAITTLKLFSTDDLKTCIAQRTLKGEYTKAPYSLLGIFPDGSFLLQEAMRGNNPRSLLKISPLSLKTLSIQTGDFNNVGIINNECFFTIDKDKVKGHALSLHQWNSKTETYEKTTSSYPFTHLGKLPTYTEIISLGTNRYCVKCTESNSIKFKVIVFDLDPVNFNIIVHGLIRPTEFNGHDSSPTGKMIALPNGQLLTYHSAYDHPQDHLQIWDTEKLVCIKEWNWKDIIKPANFNRVAFYTDIKCLPDSKHLIMNSDEGVFLFNIETLTMKEINLGKPVACKTPHILATSQLLSFMKHNYDNILPVMQFDVKEMYDYRMNLSTFNMSKHCVSHRFFKNMPQDVVDILVTYAFSSEAKAEFSCVKPEPENKKENCAMM